MGAICGVENKCKVIFVWWANFLARIGEKEKRQLCPLWGSHEAPGKCAPLVGLTKPLGVFPPWGSHAAPGNSAPFGALTQLQEIVPSAHPLQSFGGRNHPTHVLGRLVGHKGFMR